MTRDEESKRGGALLEKQESKRVRGDGDDNRRHSRPRDEGMDPMRDDPVSNADIIALDIGGTKFTATRGTLTSVPGSMLHSMFCGRHEMLAQRMKDGSYFIDRDAGAFPIVLTYLRTRRVQVPVDEEELHAAIDEAQFYQLTGLEEALRRPLPESHVYEGEPEEDQALTPLVLVLRGDEKRERHVRIYKNLLYVWQPGPPGEYPPAPPYVYRLPRDTNEVDKVVNVIHNIVCYLHGPSAAGSPWIKEWDLKRFGVEQPWRRSHTSEWRYKRWTRQRTPWRLKDAIFALYLCVSSPPNTRCLGCDVEYTPASEKTNPRDWPGNQGVGFCICSLEEFSRCKKCCHQLYTNKAHVCPVCGRDITSWVTSHA